MSTVQRLLGRKKFFRLSNYLGFMRKKIIQPDHYILRLHLILLTIFRGNVH